MDGLKLLLTKLEKLKSQKQQDNAKNMMQRKEITKLGKVKHHYNLNNQVRIQPWLNVNIHTS